MDDMLKEDRRLRWEGDPPPVDEAWHKKLYRANKKLADDLIRGSLIAVGPCFVIARGKQGGEK